MGSETGRAKRYAQYGFEDMSALERFMLRELGCKFCNFANATSSCANIKTLKKQLEICVKVESALFLLILSGRSFYGMLMPYRKCS